jgi:hypothetical protein
MKRQKLLAAALVLLVAAASAAGSRPQVAPADSEVAFVKTKP